MAAGIGTTHFTGMEAMHGAAELHYDAALFVGSILVGEVQPRDPWAMRKRALTMPWGARGPDPAVLSAH